MRQLILAANWKMHKTIDDADFFFQRFNEEVNNITGLEVVFCPPFTALYSVAKLIKETSFALGAQNMHWAKEGSYTGEISPLMLREMGVRYVILGHSERRLFFREQPRDISLKVASAFNFGLHPILCIGETEEERRQGLTETVLCRQLREGLADSLEMEQELITRLVVAYEPVWAIGTGEAASQEDAAAAARVIRSFLGELLGPEKAAGIRVQYGGSVSSENIVDFVALPDIDGALVGGASLKPHSFQELILALDQLRRS